MVLLTNLYLSENNNPETEDTRFNVQRSGSPGEEPDSDPKSSCICYQLPTDAGIPCQTYTTTSHDSAPRMDPLFIPMQIGTLTLTHRVILAPLTRLRASPEGVPDPSLAGLYYEQRATSGGLLITEATAVSRQGTGRFRAPGFYTADQIHAWKSITERVHKKGGFIFLQLWHTGRASHSVYQSDGQPPVGPSPIAIEGETLMPDGTMAPFQIPREITIREITTIVEDYKIAAKHATLAGFDGVEIQIANGYLIDQFLHDGSNKRTDKYGGSIRNRCRFALAVVSAVRSSWLDAVGEKIANVGVRLSPFGTDLDMRDSDEMELYKYLVIQLNDENISYLHLIQPRIAPTLENGSQETDVICTLGKLFKGPITIGGGFLPDAANSAIYKASSSDPSKNLAIAFGRLFISNPDLPLRIFLRAALNEYDRSTFSSHGPEGYTDQLFLEEEVVKESVKLLQFAYPGSTQWEHAITQTLQRMRF